MKKNNTKLGLIIGGVLLAVIAGLAVFTQGEIFQGRLGYTAPTPKVTVARIAPKSNVVSVGSHEDLFGLSFTANQNMLLKELQFQSYVDNDLNGKFYKGKTPDIPHSSDPTVDTFDTNIEHLVNGLTLYIDGKRSSHSVPAVTNLNGLLTYDNLNIPLSRGKKVNVVINGIIRGHAGPERDRIKFGIPSADYIGIYTDKRVPSASISFKNGVKNGGTKNQGPAIMTIDSNEAYSCIVTEKGLAPSQWPTYDDSDIGSRYAKHNLTGTYSDYPSVVEDCTTAIFSQLESAFCAANPGESFTRLINRTDLSFSQGVGQSCAEANCYTQNHTCPTN